MQLFGDSPPQSRNFTSYPTLPVGLCCVRDNSVVGYHDVKYPTYDLNAFESTTHHIRMISLNHYETRSAVHNLFLNTKTIILRVVIGCEKLGASCP